MPLDPAPAVHAPPAVPAGHVTISIEDLKARTREAYEQGRRDAGRKRRRGRDPAKPAGGSHVAVAAVQTYNPALHGPPPRRSKGELQPCQFVKETDKRRWRLWEAKGKDAATRPPHFNATCIGPSITDIVGHYRQVHLVIGLPSPPDAKRQHNVDGDTHAERQLGIFLNSEEVKNTLGEAEAVARAEWQAIDAIRSTQHPRARRQRKEKGSPSIVEATDFPYAVLQQSIGVNGIAEELMLVVNHIVVSVRRDVLASIAENLDRRPALDLSGLQSLEEVAAGRQLLLDLQNILSAPVKTTAELLAKKWRQVIDDLGGPEDLCSGQSGIPQERLRRWSEASAGGDWSDILGPSSALRSDSDDEDAFGMALHYVVTKGGRKQLQPLLARFKRYLGASPSTPALAPGSSSSITVPELSLSQDAFARAARDARLKDLTESFEPRPQRRSRAKRRKTDA